MRWRARLKYWAHTALPGLRGVFRYFGALVYFPPRSMAFKEICRQGIFEQENLQLMAGLVAYQGLVYDVGANIGQTAVPLLSMRPDIRVVSFEPSPGSLPWLQRTLAASPFASRWTLVEKAAGAAVGDIEFQVSPPEFSLFDGAVHTARAPLEKTIKVPLTRLDDEWIAQGRPPVSMIKIDTEGGEVEVITGARALIAACRPTLVIEWSKLNLAARKIEPQTLLALAAEHHLSLHAVPSLARIETAVVLNAAMAFTETYLLAPLEARQAG